MLKKALRFLRYERLFIKWCARKRPDFVIIGSMRSGTTSLYQYLKSHPDVIGSSVKEPSFFSWDSRMGIKKYMSLFPLKEEATDKLVFEASATYLHHRKAARRLNAAIPSIKIIVNLRDPIARAVSHYNYYANPESPFGLENPEQIETRDITQAFTDDLQGHEHRWNKKYCRFSLYGEQLEPYYELFGSQNILTLELQQMEKDPGSLMGRVSRFLGIDDSWFSAHQSAANKTESDVSLSADNKMQFDVHNAQEYDIDLPQELREALVGLYRDDVTRLQEITGERFSWSSDYA